MNGVLEAENFISLLSRAEKAQVLQWIVKDLGDSFPGIESTAGVCGGAARIVRTRIPVWTLEQARRLGTNESDLLKAFPFSDTTRRRFSQRVGVCAFTQRRNRKGNSGKRRTCKVNVAALTKINTDYSYVSHTRINPHYT